MSTDTNVVLWTSDPEEKLAKIYDGIVSEAPDYFQLVSQHFGDKWLVKEWNLDDRKILSGPGGWSLKANEKTILIYHITRFGSLDRESELGEAILDSINWFGKMVGSDQAIFTHELFPVPDKSISKSIQMLENEFKAAKSWQEMSRATCFSDNCWLIVSLPFVLYGSEYI